MMSLHKRFLIADRNNLRHWSMILTGLLLYLCASYSNAEPEFGRYATAASTQTSALTPWHHPWGTYAPASWVRLQCVNRTFREEKTVRSVDEIKRTLKSIENGRITISESSLVDLGGKRIQTPEKNIQTDFFDQPIGDNVQVYTGEPGKLIIDHLIIPCETRIYESIGRSGKTRSTVWYSMQIYPYVLRVEKVLRSKGLDGSTEEKVLSQSTTEVIETDALIPRKNKNGKYKTRTVRRTGEVTTVTESECSRYIPGGIEREKIRELDQLGREIRVVETRLINYHLWGMSENQP